MQKELNWLSWSGCRETPAGFRLLRSQMLFHLALLARKSISIPSAGKAVCLLHPPSSRDAENRTRSSRTRSARTTGILHPDYAYFTSYFLTNDFRCTALGPNLFIALRCSPVGYPLCRAKPYFGKLAWSSRIILSRCTLAIIEAAETERIHASASITLFCSSCKPARSKPGIVNRPSTKSNIFPDLNKFFLARPRSIFFFHNGSIRLHMG